MPDKTDESSFHILLPHSSSYEAQKNSTTDPVIKETAFICYCSVSQPGARFALLMPTV